MSCGSPTCLSLRSALTQPQSSRNNSSCRRCIFRNHLRSSRSWGLFQAKERQRRGTCARGSGGCGHVPLLCFLPVGALPSCSSHRAASFQTHGLLDISSQVKSCLSPTWQGAGSSPAQGLKGSQGDSWAPAGGRAGDEGGRPPAMPLLTRDVARPQRSEVTARSSGDAGGPLGLCVWALLTMASVSSRFQLPSKG